MNVVPLVPKQKLPPDFSARLRALADRVDAGQVTCFVGIAAVADNFETMEPSSHADSLMLAALLQHAIAVKFFKP